MNNLNQLPDITDQVLSSLKADENLKHRILVAAANEEVPSSSFAGKKRSLIALIALTAVLILSVIGIGSLSLSQDGISPSSMHVLPAGSHRNTSPVQLQVVIDEVIENHIEYPDASPSPELSEENGL